jgi:hypothetical protein
MLNSRKFLGAMRLAGVFAFSVLLAGCGGGNTSLSTNGSGPVNGSSGGGNNTGGGGNSGGGSGGNVVPITVDSGPASTPQADLAYVSVTVCLPGSTTCQTIDHIQLDTGSEGLRLISSVLTLALPQQKDSSGNAIAECAQFVSGYTWGPVQSADIKLGSEQASNVPIQVIGGGAANLQSVPAACTNTGLPAEQTVDALGANGILGIGPFRQDCGSGCTTDTQNGFYFSCSTVCQEATATLTQQLQNPVWMFAADNNGTIIQLPSIPASGAATVSGSLIFGIATQSNNGLGTAKILTLDNAGNFTTQFQNVSYNQSFIDSGSNGIFFLDSTTTKIPDCPSPNNGFYCPTTTSNFTAANVGVNGAVSNVSFSIANALALDPNFAAFNDLGGSNPGSFDWGLAFFFGRNVFTGIEGQTSPGATGPFVAY